MSEANIEARLARVEAGLAIQQLPVRYAMAVDSRDMDALAQLYVDDIDFGELGRGHEVLKTYFTKATSIFYRRSTRYWVIATIWSMRITRSAKSIAGQSMNEATSGSPR